ncbi:hypothetical protein pipiens_000506, partial [Culex pipiens pipiens]
RKKEKFWQNKLEFRWRCNTEFDLVVECI